MNPIVQQVVQIVGDSGVVVGALYALNKKFPLLVKAENVIKKSVPLLQEVEHLAGELVDTPAAKLEVMHIKNQYDELMGKFKESEIGRVTATVLNGFSETLDQLTTTQKEAIVLQISTMVPKEWNITRQEIEVALDAVQKASNVVAEVPYIKSANQFKQDVQATQTATA